MTNSNTRKKDNEEAEDIIKQRVFREEEQRFV